MHYFVDEICEDLLMFPLIFLLRLTVEHGKQHSELHSLIERLSILVNNVNNEKSTLYLDIL